MVIDPSASHLAYALVEIDFKEKCIIFNSVGMLWTSSSLEKGQRFSYMRQAISFLMQQEPCPYAVYTEGFFANPKQMSGSAVIPTVNGIIEMVAAEESLKGPQEVEYFEVSPPSWRAILGIKPNVTEIAGKKKRDYKIPTKTAVEARINSLIPDQINSNVNLKPRNTPYDISDVMAIALAVAKEHGITRVELSSTCFDNPVILRQLETIKVKKGKK